MKRAMVWMCALAGLAMGQSNSLVLCDEQASGSSNCMTWQAPATIGSSFKMALPAKQWIDAKGFTAWGTTATINDSTASGYVVSGIWEPFVNQDNEVRGMSVVVHATRTTVDEQTYGWDQFGVAGVVKLGAMNLPSDPIYGSPYIRGQQKPLPSELYYLTPITPYTANLGLNYTASLARIAAGVTLNNWAGLTVAQPGYLTCDDEPPYTCGSGHVVNGSGIWVQNLDDGNHIIDSTLVSAMQINGVGPYGRIWWTCPPASRPCAGASIYSPSLGTLEFSGSTSVQTASTVGLRVGGAAANAGLAAGSYSVGSTQIIDGSGDYSTTGYVNAASFYLGGAKYLQTSSGNLQIMSGVLAQNATGTYEGINAGSYAIAGTTVIDGSGDYSTAGYVNAASFYLGGAKYLQTSSGNLQIMSGVLAQNATGTYEGVNAGSYAIAGATVIDGSGDYSTAGYVNAASFYLGGAKYLQTSSGNLQIMSGVLAQNAAGTYEGVNAGSYAIAGATVIDGSGDYSTAGYVNAASFKVGGTTVVDGSRNATFGALTITSCSGCPTGTTYTGSGGVQVVGSVISLASTGTFTGALAVGSITLNGGGTLINTSGAFVGAGVSTTYGITGGSFAIGAATIIDGSGNVSTTGYLNGASLSIGGSSTINSSRQWIGSAIGDSYISSAATWNGKVSAVYGSGGISSSGGTTPTISCANCVLLGGSQINSSGVFVGAGVNTPSYGVNAGSYAIAGTTIIDGSRNVSTTGYLNGASLSIGGSSTINSSRQWIGSAIGDSYISSAATWNGKVSSVGGSGAISSSGGTAPTISCSTCITTSGGTITGGLTVGSLTLYGGGTLINTSGAFIGAGVSVGGYGVTAGSFAINGGYYGATGSFVDQGGTTHQYRGGIILN